MSTTQLNPVIFFETPKGRAFAVLVTDGGIDHDRTWTCIVMETGEVWDFKNADVRAVKNETLGVNCPKPMTKDDLQ